MWQNQQFLADFVTFTEEILNGKPHFFVQCIIPYIRSSKKHFLKDSGDKEAEKKKKKWILKEIIATAKVKAILKLKVRFRNLSSFEQNFFSEYVWHQQL